MSKKPVPKQKQAVSSTRSRKAKWMAEQRKRLKNLAVIDTCSVTGEAKRRHFASPSGFYRGKQVLGIQEEETTSSVEVVDASNEETDTKTPKSDK